MLYRVSVSYAYELIGANLILRTNEEKRAGRIFFGCFFVPRVASEERQGEEENGSFEVRSHRYVDMPFIRKRCTIKEPELGIIECTQHKKQNAASIQYSKHAQQPHLHNNIRNAICAPEQYFSRTNRSWFEWH